MLLIVSTYGSWTGRTAYKIFIWLIAEEESDANIDDDGISLACHEDVYKNKGR